jgi:hypothetical protein
VAPVTLAGFDFLPADLPIIAHLMSGATDRVGRSANRRHRWPGSL